jgi:hypothetical protein
MVGTVRCMGQAINTHKMLFGPPEGHKWEQQKCTQHVGGKDGRKQSTRKTKT